jgi:hypothetical protein
VIDPIFWLGVSILLVAASLTAVLVVTIPAIKELARAARSAEKLFDTLSRELPPTLESIRLTGMEISELTDEMSDGIQSAGQVVKQVDQTITGVKQQAKRVQMTSRSVFVGFQAAWKTLRKPSGRRRGGAESLPYGSAAPVEFDEPEDDDDLYAIPSTEGNGDRPLEDDPERMKNSSGEENLSVER